MPAGAPGPQEARPDANVLIQWQVPSLEDFVLRVIGTVLRIFSYLYHLILSLFLTALGGLTLASGLQNLKLTMLPWTGSQLTWWVFGLGIAGLMITILAITGLFRFFFPLWCLFVFIMMFRGFFLLGAFVFTGRPQFYSILWLTIGALVTFLASLTLLRPAKSRY